MTVQHFINIWQTDRSKRQR